jgi:hypothetical protein
LLKLPQLGRTLVTIKSGIKLDGFKLQVRQEFCYFIFWWTEISSAVSEVDPVPLCSTRLPTYLVILLQEEKILSSQVMSSRKARKPTTNNYKINSSIRRYSALRNQRITQLMPAREIVTSPGS